jgi:hypothetical protein
MRKNNKDIRPMVKTIEDMGHPVLSVEVDGDINKDGVKIVSGDLYAVPSTMVKRNAIFIVAMAFFFIFILFDSYFVDYRAFIVVLTLLIFELIRRLMISSKIGRTGIFSQGLFINNFVPATDIKHVYIQKHDLPIHEETKFYQVIALSEDYKKIVVSRFVSSYMANNIEKEIKNRYRLDGIELVPRNKVNGIQIGADEISVKSKKGELAKGFFLFLTGVISSVLIIAIGLMKVNVVLVIFLALCTYPLRFGIRTFVRRTRIRAEGIYYRTWRGEAFTSAQEITKVVLYMHDFTDCVLTFYTKDKEYIVADKIDFPTGQSLRDEIKMRYSIT